MPRQGGFIQGPPRVVKDDHKPSFLITIDTEGDDLWSKPRTITVRNAEFLPRFQSLCESYGLKPTYLANYEMAKFPFFQEFGKDVLERETGEIGMHLHAWNSPPLVPLTQDDVGFQPYLVEYPTEVMREKIAVMTDVLENTFGVKMVSHRAGRWSFNEIYAQILVEKGYQVDCSVTPHVSWKLVPGDPEQNGGTDYSRFPDKAYFVDLEDISRPGDSPLLELPVTIIPTHGSVMNLLRRVFKDFPLARRALDHFFPPFHKLVPDGRNRGGLLRVVRKAVRDKRDYVELVLHSSELMPGCSPNFPGEEDIKVLYDDLEMLFDEIRDQFVGATLKEYYQVNSSFLRRAR
jgi:hypothetical protein